MKRILLNEKGATLPLVLVIFMVLFVLGVSLLQIGMSETKETTWQNNRVQAHYLARSGIEIGKNMLEDELSTFPQTGTLDDLAIALNNAVDSSYTIDGVGDFIVGFSVTPLNEIKVTSVGTTLMANPSASKTVTFTKKLTKAANFENAGSEWFHTNDFHFSSNVFPDEGVQPNPKSFLGRIAFLGSETKAIQNPSVGSPSKISTFRASIINFGEFDGVSINASSNSYVRFDSEIVYFNGRIETKNNSYMEMLLSDKVLAQKTSDEYDSNYPNPVGDTPGGEWTLDFVEHDNINEDGDQILEGFESDERYISFMSNFTETTPSTSYRPSSFEDDVNYGIVRLVRIDESNTTVLTPDINNSKGYYYFPENTRLDKQSSGDGDYGTYYGRDDLIEINDNDPITNVLDDLYKWNYGSSQGVWNYQ